MKHQILEKIQIPDGVSCSYSNGILRCSKNSVMLERKIILSRVEIKVVNNEIILACEKGNKNQHKQIMACLAHIKNMFLGLDEKYVYQLEACNVHFPMTLKVESNKFVINNFLGEKMPRYAKILPSVEVEVDGQKITVSSNNLEAAGQTAANLERTTKIRSRDRRIFQDGIFIVEKPGRKKQ